MKLLGTAFLTVCLLVGTVQASEAEGLLEKSGVKGGLCLVVGAKDTALAEDLAAKSALYVQVLQPDAKLATAWGVKIAAGPCRENVSVRNAAFDPEHYGGDLFNLIVVSGAKAKLKDLYRILVPRGVVVFKDAAGNLAGQCRLHHGQVGAQAGEEFAGRALGVEPGREGEQMVEESGAQLQEESRAGTPDQPVLNERYQSEAREEPEETEYDPVE